VNLIELRFPSLVTCLAPFDSPWEAVQAVYGHRAVAYVVSCPSQRSALLLQAQARGEGEGPAEAPTDGGRRPTQVAHPEPAAEYLTPEVVHQAVMVRLTGGETAGADVGDAGCEAAATPAAAGAGPGAGAGPAADVGTGGDAGPGAAADRGTAERGDTREDGDTRQAAMTPAAVEAWAGAGAAPGTGAGAAPGADPAPAAGPLRTRSEGLLTVTGIRHVITVLEQVENGLLSDVDVLDLYACEGGCFGSPLLPEDHHVASHRWDRGRVAADMGVGTAVTRRRPFAARPGIRLDEDMGRAIQKLGRMQALIRSLPGRDCGACGAPTCAALAEDVVMERAVIELCPYASPASDEKEVPDR